MQTDNPIPAFGVSKRNLHFFWLVDSSSSMSGAKIQSLNQSVRNALPEVRRVASENPHVNVFMRVIKFGSHAEWVVKEPTPLESFNWQDISASGMTAMGEAFTLAAEGMDFEQMGRRNIPPVMVLVTDGQATDDAESALANLKKSPWGRKSVRVGIAIGQDADRSMIVRFIDDPNIPVLEANNPDQLAAYIKWVSTEALKSASGVNSSQDDKKATIHAPVPAVQNVDDVF